MKAKNYHVYGDATTVQHLREEYEYLGRIARIAEPGHLIVFALPPQKESKKKSEERRGKNSRPDSKGRREAKQDK